MVFFSDYFQHKQDCRRKQQERRTRIATLPPSYCEPLSPSDRAVLSRPIQDLVHDVQESILHPVDVLRVYGKVAVKAQEKTNCLTEILLPEAEQWATSQVNLKGPLAGIPVSIKDTLHVAGYDTSVGYSCNVGKPHLKDGVSVRLLKEAGAVPYVKTNVPTSLLSFESTNDVWGRTTNPHNKKYSPGGSSGGEGAIIALGGRIGIGTDVAGSVRAPAHFSGCYSLRCSTGRWPKVGLGSSMYGQEGVPAVASPMARTLNDLTYFTRSLLMMKPWRLDYTCHPIDWRDDAAEEAEDKERLRIGVLRNDGVVTPSPACARALQETVAALKLDGHEVFDVHPPSPEEGLRIASILLNSDGCRSFNSWIRPGEWTDKGAAQFLLYMRIPRPIKYLWYLWVKYVQRDDIWAGLLRQWHPKSAYEQWLLVAQREAYRARWHEWWQEEAKMDFMLTPTNALPATPHDAMKTAAMACGYTFLFNLLDYTCGVLPVTHVDSTLDALPSSVNISKMNGVARGIYKYYDAADMAGLPVTVQVVGQRLTEEKVLAYMERVESALETHNGGKYTLLELD